MRTLTTTLLALLLAGLSASPASAWVYFAADATTKPGQIEVHLAGSGTFTGVDLVERVDGADVPLRTVVPLTVTAPDGTQISSGIYPVATWRCDRLTRVLNAVARRADGSEERAAFSVRTPSCRNRLTLVAPRTVRPGARVTLRVRDRFKLGGLAPRLCTRPPGAPQRCRGVRIAPGGSVGSTTFRARRRGHWRVRLTAPPQTLDAVVSVGIAPPAGAPGLPLVLATGDSLMQSTDAVLGDRLTHRARMLSDVRVGSKISLPNPVDWSRLPGVQMKRHGPAATVIFLGNVEGFPMKTRAGDEVVCCGEPWIAEFARRSRHVFEAYRRGGRAVVWLNVPIARDSERRTINLAVNAALARAVQGLERAALVDAAKIFTPGGVYRDAMTDRGRSVRVREPDGVHLSPEGAAIAVRAVVEQLERLGVV
jgi:hypothetical protein